MVRNSTESLVRVALLWVLVAAMAAPARAGPIPQPLLQAARARGAVAYRGEQIVVAWEGAARAQASLVRIEHDPPAWTRLDYVPLGPNLRWTVIRRDTVEIRFDPLRLTGTTGPHASADEDAFETAHLPWLLENYRIATTQDALLGRKVTRIELVPAAGDRPTHRLTVDDETGVVLRSERIGPDGSLGEVTAFLRFEIMPVGWRKNATMPAGLHLTPQARVRTASAADVVRVLGGPPPGSAAGGCGRPRRVPQDGGVPHRRRTGRPVHLFRRAEHAGRVPAPRIRGQPSARQQGRAHAVRPHLGAASGPAHAGALVACGPGADDRGRSLARRLAGRGGAHRDRVRSANLARACARARTI